MKQKVKEYHGLHRHPLYQVWANMKSRCLNSRHRDYSKYGGRGITVCERWQDSFSSFLLDMGERPSEEYSLDRIDNNGPYDPSNCRWATKTEQAQNTRMTHWVEVNGVTKCLSDWAASSGVPLAQLVRRLQRGWAPERAVRPERSRRDLFFYQGDYYTLKSLAEAHGLKPVDLRYRLNKGHSLEAALKMKPCKHGYKLKAE